MNKQNMLTTYPSYIFFIISAIIFYTITNSYLSYINYSGFIEVREYCNTLLGKNIASGSYFSLQDFPQNIYLYGPLQGIILSIATEITIHANRLLSCFFLASTIIPIYFIASKIFIKHSKYISFQYALLSYIAILCVCTRDLYINAGRPDQIGLFIYFSAFALVLSSTYKQSTSFMRGVISSFVVCMALLTKQYYGVVLLLFYAIELTNIQNFRNTVLYFTTSITIIILFFVATYQFIPVYFMSYFHHINVASYSLDHQLNQSLEFLKTTNIFCALSVASLFAYRQKNLHPGGKYLPIALFLLAIILIVLLKLGGHQGNYMVYYNQLIFPPLIIISMFTISTFKEKITPLIILIGLIITVAGNAKHITDLERKGNTNGSIQKINIKLQQLDTNSKAFICPTSLQYNINDTNFTEIDAGQVEYMNTLGYPKILTFIFPKLEIAKQSLQRYETALSRKVRNKEFVIIYYDEYCVLNRHKKEINAFYEKFTVNNTTIYTDNETIKEHMRLNYTTN